MTRRCYDKKHEAYPHYGGRGIRVYFDWIGRGGFEQFLTDVGNRPSLRHTIGRIDPDKHYEPGNVQWETKQQQNQRLLYDGGKAATVDGVTRSRSGLHTSGFRTRHFACA